MSLNENEYPQRVILGLSQELDAFKRAVKNMLFFELTDQQVKELVTQIFHAYLTQNTAQPAAGIPNFNLMIGSDDLAPHARQVIAAEVNTLSAVILSTITRLDDFQGQSFPYIFDSFLGSDVVLYHIPY